MCTTPQLSIGGISLAGQGASVAFTDGSALHPACPVLRRAGWGLFFPPHVRACGPLPGPSQTINRAELWAICNFAAARPPADTAHSDSTVTVSGAKRVAAGDIPAVNADLWVIYLACLVPGTVVHYVPAHLEPEEAEAKGVAQELRLGNAEADRLARIGAEAHAVPSEEAADVLEQLGFADQVQSLQWQILKEVCKVEPMRGYRRVPRLPRGAIGPRRRRGPKPSDSVGAHVLEHVADGVVCTRCGRRGRIARSAKSWRQQPCVPRVVAHFGGAEAHGHVIWERGGRVGCTRCGRDMARAGRSRLIHAKCTPRPRPISRARGKRDAGNGAAPEGHILRLLQGDGSSGPPVAAKRASPLGGAEAQASAKALRASDVRTVLTQLAASSAGDSSSLAPRRKRAAPDPVPNVEACGPFSIAAKRQNTAGLVGPLAACGPSASASSVRRRGHGGEAAQQPSKRSRMEDERGRGPMDIGAFFRALPCADRGIDVEFAAGAEAQGELGSSSVLLSRRRPPEPAGPFGCLGAEAHCCTSSSSEALGLGAAAEAASGRQAVAAPAPVGDSPSVVAAWRPQAPGEPALEGDPEPVG